MSFYSGLIGMMTIRIFAPPMGGSYEFVTDTRGSVTGMRLHGVSGMRTAVRAR
jgi:hypothetical protein